MTTHAPDGVDGILDPGGGDRGDIDLGENPLALDRQVCFALAVASRSVIGIYRPLLEPLGLTHPQYLVMLALWDREPRTVKDIGATLRLEPATLSPMLKRLESLGYLSRRRSSQDERALSVELTEVGRALRAEAEKIPYAVVRRLGVGVEDLMALHTALGDVITAAERIPD
ncbi:MarR family winged helix-turn-helix transcriptional regulator [Sporichthya polymorpha]|uniref:MarR family winged helix-turn-helix transcriptional regulator n=1 Tax=Sporichthya polymorpha TaxID=35751 RepID=UPI000361B184|nr:MarR family transcriptional regulator [Sporichthya polymorpha]